MTMVGNGDATAASGPYMRVAEASGDLDRRDTALLLTGYGGPDCIEAVEPFLVNLLGRAPEPDLLEQVRRRYLAVGGCSPMLAMAARIAAAVEARVSERGRSARAAYAMRYSPPFISDVLRDLYESGVRRVVVVSLSPYSSAISTGACDDAICQMRSELPEMRFVKTELLYKSPAFRDVLTEAAAGTLSELAAVSPKLLLFTAHSLPISDAEDDCSYPAQVREVLDAIIGNLGLAPGRAFNGDPTSMLPGVAGYGSMDAAQPWAFSYQSKGRKPGPWLGPDLDDVIDAAVEGGFRGVAICPIGFVADNMETRYDLDVVAALRLSDMGVECRRSSLPNDDPRMIDAIASLVEAVY